ncbi:hypothetical protein [Cytobacillus purgationiresistens]|uniref:Uncharacterized protein n=1 Tax=Cytobacillus purgationiresistens TaxID=863449 RepID=A0ABU0AIY8_9BACI|nr:hypothetical protein [Cytobacillus purgationiresistens]MDQ0271229.1 hypothetical protein [Cytobacillus purgationiresistens]
MDFLRDILLKRRATTCVITALARVSSKSNSTSIAVTSLRLQHGA